MSMLNLIPFAALVDESNRYLIQNAQITYLTSARDLTRLDTRAENRKGVLLVGNPDFNDESNKARASSFENRQPGDPATRKYPPLPGTREEIQVLEKILSGALILSGKEATETFLKRISAPHILHIATHGFFLANQKREPERSGFAAPDQMGASGIENIMLRSGLALAGANVKNSEQEDGLLTALEVANLDLYGTKLVVLSACDTGLGEAKTSDGVYGLRRALVLAGSETQLMSFWKVDDKVTRDMMVEYYVRLLRGEARGEALRKVQLAMLKSKEYSHPYYWASFIQSGDWRNLEVK